MNTKRLERNILDQIIEEQLKLGYQKETIYLYFPLQSLNRLLEVNLSVDEMQESIKQFKKDVKDRFGEVDVAHKGDRFCIQLPPEAAEYVHLHKNDAKFLEELIETVVKHNISRDDVIDVFKKHSDNVVVQEMKDEDFDLLIYFEDGRPDEYRYCIHDEGPHFIYHRYTKEDYEDMFGA